MRARDLRDLLRGDLAKIHHALAERSERTNLLRRALGVARRWSEPSGRHAIKLPYCPPLALAWSWREPHGERSPAQVVHAAFLREAWRERGWIARAGLLAPRAAATC